MQNENIELIAYKLCPYVQRSVITLKEKGVKYRRIDIDLSNKPGWFLERSPTGKVPVLTIDNEINIFESAVICEYLDELTEGPLLPSDPTLKAFQRSWIEFASQTLDVISRYYGAKDRESFYEAQAKLRDRFEKLEQAVIGPYFSGVNFMMVDAAYAPVFRYFDVFAHLIQIELFDGLKKTNIWRKQLASRQSVKDAVSEDFAKELIEFVVRKQSYLSGLLQERHGFIL